MPRDYEQLQPLAFAFAAFVAFLVACRESFFDRALASLPARPGSTFFAAAFLTATFLGVTFGTLMVLPPHLQLTMKEA